MVNSLLVKMYASNILTYGNRNFTTIPEIYAEPVKEYIALNYSNYEIDKSLENRYITEEEYTEIMTLKSKLTA